MRNDINKMKDYYEVLDFVSITAPQIGNANPQGRADFEAMLDTGAPMGGDFGRPATSG